MAYGLKYELLCTSKKSNLYKAKISEIDYVGAEINRNVPLNPFILRKDRAAVIKGTSFEFIIREAVDFEFLPFYTSVPKKYLVEVYKATALLWSGYINTQQYSAPYKPVPNNITFMASDGLGLLKNEKFTLTGREDEFTIIRHCIDKIGLGLGYVVAISMWEANHDTSLSPLEQTYQDCSNFDDNNCYEVLEKILSRYTAEISQWAGRWHIISSIDKDGDRLYYSSAGAYDDNYDGPIVLRLAYPDVAGADVYPVESPLTHSLQAGGKKVKLTHDYGLRKSLLKNYEFELYAASMFTDWTKGGTFAISQYLLSGKFFAYLSGYSNVDTDFMSQAIAIVNTEDHSFVFEIDVCPVGYISHGGGEIQSTTLTVRIQITLLVGGTTYYLSTAGWTETPGYITQNVASAVRKGTITWTKIQILTDELPGSGTLTIKLQRLKYVYDSIYGYLGVAFLEPSIYFLDTDGLLYPDKTEVEATFDNSSEMVDLAAVDMIAGDAPDVANKSLLYNKITRFSDDTPTLTWKLANNDTAFTLVQLHLKLLASLNRVPRQTLTGTIKGTAIYFNVIIQHVYNSNRKFEIAECEWDMYEEKFRAKLLEILAFSDEDITLDDATTLGSAADLTVASVTPGTNPVAPSTAFNTTVHIDNSGGMPGQNTIQWRIVDDDEVVISSGTHLSGIIAASGHEDHVIAMTSPATPATDYHIQCKMIRDTSWVTSAHLNVFNVVLNHIDAIAEGIVFNPMTLSFQATSSAAGNVRVYWKIYDKGDALYDSGSEDISVASGTGTYNFTGLTYPADADTDYYAAIYLAGGSEVTGGAFDVTES
jgi:hypothetical protein